jgi:hypothetical protein
LIRSVLLPGRDVRDVTAGAEVEVPVRRLVGAGRGVLRGRKGNTAIVCKRRLLYVM